MEFTLSTKELDDLVEQRISEGWRWTGSEKDQPVGMGKMLLPPKGDVRETWTAMWIEYKPGVRLPHWICRELGREDE